MEFRGAAAYLFELGLKYGHKRLITSPEEYLEGRLVFNNPVAIEAITAFKDGFSIGSILSQDEYNKLTLNNKNV